MSFYLKCLYMSLSVHMYVRMPEYVRQGVRTTGAEFTSGCELCSVGAGI